MLATISQENATHLLTPGARQKLKGLMEGGGSSSKGRNMNPVCVSALHIVDLAGSERVSKTGATGDRLTEAQSINKSLFVLGRIIKELSEKAKAQQLSGRNQGKRRPRAGSNANAHLPYRESQLTRLLSSSLGGNALTSLVCCISPALRNREESRSTLEFATMASFIVNRARKNFVGENKALIAKYMKEIAELKEIMRRERLAHAPVVS